jgi:type IV pilus assembly protein PilW
MLSSNNYTSSNQAGFSLVEIMVGLVIGLLATMVIMQVFAVFEGQKRSTTGSADAQTNGSIALYAIARDAQMAGFGLPVFDTVNAPLKCDPSPSSAGIDMFPIAITDSADANGSDRIAIRYGPTPMGGVPVRVLSVAGNVVGVDNNMGCQNGDIAMISNGAACAMTSVSDLDLAADTTHITLVNATGAIPNASVACLGGWNEFLYRVNNNRLERNGAPSTADIVNIQAQYGISAAANSNIVTAWVDASGGTWAAPTIANRNRIKAIRIAVVARNGQLEKEDVTEACSSTTAAAPTGLCAWAGSAASPAPAIDLTAPANWQRYRYRVYETIIPLRNIIWSGNTL